MLSLKLKSILLVSVHLLTSSFQSSMPHSSVAVLQAPVTQTFSSLTMTTGEQILSKAASSRLTRGRVKRSRIVCSLPTCQPKPCGNRFMSEHQLLYTRFNWPVYFSLKKCQHSWELEDRFTRDTYGITHCFHPRVPGCQCYSKCCRLCSSPLFGLAQCSPLG